MLAVVFYLACVGLALTLSLLGPIFVGLLVGEIDVVQRLGVYFLLGGFIFGGPVLSIMGRLRRVPHIGRLVLLLLVWMVMPIMAAIPFENIIGMRFIDALFESVSGLTTTGSSILNTINEWPQAMIFWRAQLQWYGGFLALLSVILVLAPLGIGGITKPHDSMTVGADLKSTDGRLVAFITNLALLYTTMTALCFLGFFITGTRAFYAMTLAMTATSTGGFLPFDGSVDDVLGVGGMFVFGLFLLLGATSIFWQRMVMAGKKDVLVRHRESYSVIALIALLTIGFIYVAISISAGTEKGALSMVVEAFFNGASLVSTSGVETRPGYFTLMPLVIVLFVILIGGSAFSTSGGLKHYRLGGMLVKSWGELDNLVYPNVVRQSHFGSERYDIQLMKAIWSLFVVAIITICLGTIFIATTGIPFEAALTATVSNFATAGPVYYSGWAAPGTVAWPPYSAFSDQAKYALMILMLLGRLEVLAVIGLFSIRYWRSR
ncbi:MAG: potassium transporter TrkG [Rhizobiaceae bacterium]